jgi:hypothetical protein
LSWGADDRHIVQKTYGNWCSYCGSEGYQAGRRRKGNDVIYVKIMTSHGFVIRKVAISGCGEEISIYYVDSST